MTMKFNEDGLNKLASQIAEAAERAMNRGIELAKGQPLDQAAETVAREMAQVGVTPNRPEIHKQLEQFGWK